jgi:hypothetical protein
MAITPAGDNTVALTGIDMFNYFITHFNMSSEDAINEMRAKNQDLKWFDSFSDAQKDFVMSKMFAEKWAEIKEEV